MFLTFSRYGPPYLMLTRDYQVFKLTLISGLLPLYVRARFNDTFLERFYIHIYYTPYWYVLTHPTHKGFKVIF